MTDYNATFAAWERWIETLKPGDICRAGGADAIVTAMNDDYVWARIIGQADAHPWDYEQIEMPNSGKAENA